MVMGWHERSAEAQDHDESTIPSLSKPVQAWGYDFLNGRQTRVLGHNYWFRDRNDNSDAVFIRLRCTPTWDTPEEAIDHPVAVAWVRDGVQPTRGSDGA